MNGAGPPSEGRSQAAGEIADAAYRQRQYEQDRYAGGSPDPATPGIGLTAGPPAAGLGGSGGGYRLSPDQLARQIARFERIADRVAKQTDRWQAAHDAVSSPSPDEPATRQASRARESIMIGWRANEAKLKRMRGFISSMKRAHGGYVTQDDDTAATLKSDGGDSDTGDLYRTSGDASPRANTGSLFERRDGK